MFVSRTYSKEDVIVILTLCSDDKRVRPEILLHVADFWLSLKSTGELSWQSLSFWNFREENFYSYSIYHILKSCSFLQKGAAIKKRKRGSLTVNTDLLMENIKAFEVTWKKNYLRNDPILEGLIC